MRCGRIGTASLTCLALAGCATAPPPSPVLAVSGTTCSTAPDLSKAASLVLPAKPGDEKPLAVTFDAQTPCVQPAAGAASYYRIFSLPFDAPPYTILVSSAPFGAGIFAARVMLLDEQGAVMREIKSDSLVFRGNALTALLRNRPGERYLVIASDANTLGKRFERTTEQTQVNFGGSYEIHTGTDTTQHLVYSANGTVAVTLALIPAP